MVENDYFLHCLVLFLLFLFFRFPLSSLCIRSSAFYYSSDTAGVEANTLDLWHNRPIWDYTISLQQKSYLPTDEDLVSIKYLARTAFPSQFRSRSQRSQSRIICANSSSSITHSRLFACTTRIRNRSSEIRAL